MSKLHISERQHGFVKRRSCLTNLIEFFEEVTKMIDEQRAVDVVYMDSLFVERAERRTQCVQVSD